MPVGLALIKGVEGRHGDAAALRHLQHAVLVVIAGAEGHQHATLRLQHPVLGSEIQLAALIVVVQIDDAGKVPPRRAVGGTVRVAVVGMGRQARALLPDVQLHRIGPQRPGQGVELAQHGGGPLLEAAHDLRRRGIMRRHVAHIDDPAFPEVDADPTVLYQTVQAVEHLQQAITLRRRQKIRDDDEVLRAILGRRDRGGGLGRRQHTIDDPPAPCEICLGLTGINGRHPAVRRPRPAIHPVHPATP